MDRLQAMRIFVPLTEQRLDLAVRVAVLHDPNLTAARLGYVQRTVVGSSEYFKKHPSGSAKGV
jgi:DNA-binding transcriptional LysR family regulator